MKIKPIKFAIYSIQVFLIGFFIGYNIWGNGSIRYMSIYFVITMITLSFINGFLLPNETDAQVSDTTGDAQ